MDHSDDGLSDKDFPLDSKDIELIQLPKGSIYLIGTAHVSKASVELAKEVIQKIRPRSVAVELCETRWKALQDPERWKKMDVVQAIRQGRGHLLLSQLLLAAFQKKLGALTEVKPGTEMLVAALTATDIGADLVLADRSIRTTLKRVWRGLGFFSAIKVLSGIIAGLFAGEKVTPDDIERLKDRDVLSGALEEFGEIFPDIETTLIEERDKYMADSIRNAVSFPLVAVVGAAHVPGMTKILREDIPVDRSVLDQVPPSGKISKILKWLIPTSIVLLILAGSFRSGKETGGAMAASWVLATSSTAALGGIIALAHPFTILVAAFVAPVTAVNPFLRSGWIAAIIEATTRRPRVGDLENILDDMTSIRGWYGNRVCRVLLVLISVNLMGIVGGALAVPILARYIW